MHEFSAKPRRQIRPVDDWVPWLAGLLQLIAAVGWLLAWIAGPFALGGAARTGETTSWEFVVIAMNSAVVIFGWPLCFVLAWIDYIRSGKRNRKRLLLITSLSYVHVLLIIVSCLVLALLEPYLDWGPYVARMVF